MTDIRRQIVARRAARIDAEGPALGHSVPAERELASVGPPRRFPQDPPIICEIKRRSPSRGEIDAALDPVARAREYRSQGARSISVLTEEDHFAGSLADLMQIKRALPELALLRKDFLLTTEDIEISYRAGADAVLLIASVLGRDRLAQMHEHATRLGLAALVEIHDEHDLAAAAAFRPPLVGINARNLVTFRVDPLHPLVLASRIEWEAEVIYESGVFEKEQAAVAAGAGFAGVLVGESVVRDPVRIPQLIDGWRNPGRDRFWPRVAREIAARTRELRGGAGPRAPLVKICGITRAADGARAVELGAAMIGFIFAESPRRADARVVRELAALDVLRVAVVTCNEAVTDLPPEVDSLVAEGAIDAVQFHGDEAPSACSAAAFPYFKALRPKDVAGAITIDRYFCPRVLVDAFDRRRPGGTGRTMHAEIVSAAGERRALWLAGGVGPENVREIIDSFGPELIDASSRLEASPGVKDHDRLRRFFDQIETHV